MLTIRPAADLRAELTLWAARGKTVGFVPTMGALHEGHLSLVRLAKEHTDRVVASVFVNPTQFGPNEDFARYPRQPERDAEMLASAGCDLLFLPEVETIYPEGHATFVEPSGPAIGLEGTFRPGHFRGVATVVAQLFNLVRPDVAVFGQKDAQQLAVIRRLVKDLHFPIQIVGAPTLREDDGLAMSSRNAYLQGEERRAATVLYRALTAAATALAGGERSGDVLRQTMHAVLASEPLVEIEYAEVVDAETFQPVPLALGELVLPIAVRLGKTRLIDNFQLSAHSTEV
jgi:pantoate--beta-alanine ligase